MAVFNIFSLLATVTFILSSSSSEAKTESLQNVNYGAFVPPATFSIANQLGYFTAYGLNVTYLQVPNSTYAYAQILNGGYDILTGTIDNAVNLRFNSNKSLTVLGQLDQGPGLVLASIANISSVLELKGKTLMVDSPTSGYAYVLRKILEIYGLKLENGDFSFTVVGGTPLRYAALINGTYQGGAVYATIITAPYTAYFSSLPASSRPNILARASDFVAPFSSTAFTVAQDTLLNATSRELVTRFVGAMYDANKLLASSNATAQKCAVNAIAAQLDVSTAIAQLEYATTTDVLTGETAPGQDGNFTVSRIGLLNVIDVRNQFGGFGNLSAGFNFEAAILPGSGKLIDYSVRDAAVEMDLAFEPKCS